MNRHNCPSTESLSTSERQLLSILNDAGDEQGQLLGRMKLMKLVFFSEYWEDSRDHLTPRNSLGGFGDFKIYKYGPFSEKLLHTFDSLKNRNLITEQEQMYGPTRITLTDEGRELAEEVRESLSTKEDKQMRDVITNFGDKDGNELEEKSLEYLGITREQKQNHQGEPVESLIQ